MFSPNKPKNNKEEVNNNQQSLEEKESFDPDFDKILGQSDHDSDDTLSAGSATSLKSLLYDNDEENEEVVSLVDAFAPQSSFSYNLLHTQLTRKVQQSVPMFNLMVAGSAQLGKSTLVNTIFRTNINAEENADRVNVHHFGVVTTTSITLVERKQRLLLTVVEASGAGTQFDSELCLDALLLYARKQQFAYLRSERNPYSKPCDNLLAKMDTRVHCCLYLIEPASDHLSPMDLMAIQKLSMVCNVIPVIAKADSFTVDELERFRKLVNSCFIF